MSKSDAKRSAGVYAADLAKQGMNLGLGSGSTVRFLINELGLRVGQGLNIVVVPTSAETADLARAANIPVSDLDKIDHLPLAIDGADEMDLQGNLIKGGGGALLQEKIVAAASGRLVIIADYSKLAKQLGKFPLPVEVIPFGHKQVREKILALGCKKVLLREKNNQVFVSDHHHYILDCFFESIGDLDGLNSRLHLIPGVVETGLFIAMAAEAIIGFDDGHVELIRYR